MTTLVPRTDPAVPESASLTAGNISVRYGQKLALDSANITLAPGTVTALVGPNGSGKSTLLKALSRQLRPESGTVSMGEHEDLAKLSARDFAKIVGLLAQQRPTPAGITVRDLVEFGRHPHRRGWRGTDPGASEAIERALALTGLAELAEATVETLSGGQLQRAWFACALAQDTTVLLLDEPTNHLDLRFQVEILDLIHELAHKHNVSIGVVLHDLSHAADIADRILLLDNGTVTADAPPREALEPERLSRTYGLPIEVTAEADGALSIRARRRGAKVVTP